jgi:hypothetical protein
MKASKAAQLVKVLLSDKAKFSGELGQGKQKFFNTLQPVEEKHLALVDEVQAQSVDIDYGVRLPLLVEILRLGFEGSVGANSATNCQQITG